MDMSLSKLPGEGEGQGSWRAAVDGVAKVVHDCVTEQPQGI